MMLTFNRGNRPVTGEQVKHRGSYIVISSRKENKAGTGGSKKVTWQ